MDYFFQNNWKIKLALSHEGRYQSAGLIQFTPVIYSDEMS